MVFDDYTEAGTFCGGIMLKAELVPSVQRSFEIPQEDLRNIPSTTAAPRRAFRGLK
jgi:hypothetical protein